ncbi:MAG: hypothetical protein ACPGVT_08220 [Maricaulaceae bacterium]
MFRNNSTLAQCLTLGDFKMFGSIQWLMKEVTTYILLIMKTPICPSCKQSPELSFTKRVLLESHWNNLVCKGCSAKLKSPDWEAPVSAVSAFVIAFSFSTAFWIKLSVAVIAMLLISTVSAIFTPLKIKRQ